MTTSSQTVPATWTQIQAGPQASVALQVFSGRINYRIATTTPQASDVGHLLLPNAEGHSIGLDTGENIYAKSVSTNLATIILTV